MKKTMSIIAGLALVTAMVSSLPTFATDEVSIPGTHTILSTAIENLEKAGETKFTYKADSSYTLIIPDDVDNLTKDTTLTVGAKKVVLETGKALDISVSSKNGWQLAYEDNEDVKIGYELSAKGKVLTVLAGLDAQGTETITVKSIDPAKMAGDYKDTLTFSVNTRDATDAEKASQNPAPPTPDPKEENKPGETTDPVEPDPANSGEGTGDGEGGDTGTPPTPEPTSQPDET